MKVLCVIPARYASTRLPGKPLKDIAGKPMICRVYDRAIQAQKVSDTIVATDDERIVTAVEANGGKAITVPNERCTFLEALALSGDMTVFTNRDKIMVMREVDGKMVSRYLDPRSSKVFKDPFFMLQQNDFIITQNTGYRNFQQSYGQFGTVLSAVSTLAGLVSTYFAIMAYRNTTK